MSSPHRRQFLAQLAGTTASLPLLNSLCSLAAPPAVRLPGKRTGKSIIILWMDGGLPHIDLWSVGRCVGTANQGPFEPIKTTAPGIQISETMPKVAEQFKHLSVIRTLDSREGERNRATLLMLSGRPPDDNGIKVPHLGAVAAHLAGNTEAALPFIAIGGTALRVGNGFLSPVLTPFLVPSAGQLPEAFKGLKRDEDAVAAARAARRKDLLKSLDDGFQRPGTAKDEEETLASRLLDMAPAAAQKQFEFDDKDTKCLESYGDTAFGRGCLLARKLVEAGVSAVQVDLFGWERGGNLTDLVRRQASGVLDPAFATLVRELAERDRLKDTLIVCLAPYGRSPRIDGDGSRRPWTRGWDIVLGGAGIKSAVEYGVMEEGCSNIKEKPVGVPHLYATLYTALGINLAEPAHDLRDNRGGRYCIAGDKQNAEPIKELLA